METTRLIQRLNKPQVFVIAGREVDNPFAFGGGMANGGLSPDAMDILRPIFSFDYMGAAEFEFGAVPIALQMIAKAAEEDDLICWSFTIPYKDIPAHWEDKNPTPDGDATVYVISRSGDVCDIEERVRAYATGNADYKDLKEPTRIGSSLRPYKEWDSDLGGWLELDNGFMFFTDREMWEKTAAVFGEDVT